MNTLLSIIDISCLIINLIALTILLWKGNKFQYHSLKPIIALFLIICIFHNISSSLEYIADIIALESYEDYVEILEPFLWGFFVFAFIQERTKEKLQQSKDVIDKKNGYNELLIDIITHDLANYNQVSNAYLEIIKEMDIKGEKLKHKINKIHNSVLNGDILISNVKALSQIEMEKIEKSTVELEPLIEIAKEMVFQLYPDVILELKRKNEGVSNLVIGHTILENVFVNLLTNTIRHKKKDQEKINVEIKIESDKENTIISFKDNSKGIEDELKDKIFDRFTDVSQKRKGTGLGLSISKRIIDSLDGKIWVENRPEALDDYSAGSVFKILLKSA